MRKTKRTRSSMIISHLPDVKKRVLKDERLKQYLNKHFKGNRGIYALYDHKDVLYYVGRTSVHLVSRVCDHLKDQHRRYWTQVSFYRTRTERAAKAIEATLIAIADPKGNINQPKFLGKKINFKNILDEAHKAENIEYGFGKRKRRTLKRASVKKRPRLTSVKRSRSTSSRRFKSFYRGKRLRIRKLYNGKTHRAALNISVKGNVTSVRYKSKSYKSLSGATHAAMKKNNGVSGWYFWKYQNRSGKQVSVRRLLAA